MLYHHKPAWLSSFRAPDTKDQQKRTQIPYTRIRAYTCAGLGAYIHVYIFLPIYFYTIFSVLLYQEPVNAIVLRVQADTDGDQNGDTRKKTVSP